MQGGTSTCCSRKKTVTGGKNGVAGDAITARKWRHGRKTLITAKKRGCDDDDGVEQFRWSKGVCCWWCPSNQRAEEKMLAVTGEVASHLNRRDEGLMLKTIKKDRATLMIASKRNRERDGDSGWQWKKGDENEDRSREGKRWWLWFRGKGDWGEESFGEKGRKLKRLAIYRGERGVEFCWMPTHNSLL